MDEAVDAQADMFCLSSFEKRNQKDHPLHRIKVLVHAAIKDFSPHFNEMYASEGRLDVRLERMLTSQPPASVVPRP